jgi:cytoskeletal protein CcmA (bactofilin family)
MFKKDGSEESVAQPRPQQAATGRSGAPRRSNGPAAIGPSITIKGDVSGDEDLVIEGRVEGKVMLAKHNVTIGPDGHVKADVNGRTVVVEGEVEGDLRGEEQIVLRHSARVEGSIAAPRVTLEDGAVFRGGIEMDAGAQGTKPMAAKEPVSKAKGADDKESHPVKGSVDEKGTGSSLPV